MSNLLAPEVNHKVLVGGNEESLLELFNPGNVFIPRGPLTCVPEEPNDETIPDTGNTCIPVPDLLDTFPLHFDPVAIFLPGNALIPIRHSCIPAGRTACFPAPDQGDAYIPPIPPMQVGARRGLGILLLFPFWRSMQRVSSMLYLTYGW